METAASSRCSYGVNRASQIAHKLLEGEEPNPEDLIAGVYATRHHQALEEGLEDILTDTRQFFDKLVKEGFIDLLQKEQERKGRPPFDPSSIAQAVLTWTIERRGAPGPKRALSNLKRWGKYRF